MLRYDKIIQDTTIATQWSRSDIPIAKIKQNQATFERGFVLATPVNHNKKKHKNQAKSSQV
jgi:hypothetical protein